jgi:hypothetical protein
VRSQFTYSPIKDTDSVVKSSSLSQVVLWCRHFFRRENKPDTIKSVVSYFDDGGNGAATGDVDDDANEEEEEEDISVTSIAR